MHFCIPTSFFYPELSISVFIIIAHPHRYIAMYAFSVSSTVLPRSGLSFGTTTICARPSVGVAVSPIDTEIRGAKHVQKKATKKHMDRRPKKKRPSDKNRKPPPYDVDPLHAAGMPSEYTVLGMLDEPDTPIVPEATPEPAVDQHTEGKVAEPVA